jgi:hypothetical protein
MVSICLENSILASVFGHKMEKPEMKRQVDNCVVHSSECKPLTNVQNSVQGNAQQVQKSDDEKRNRHRIRIQVYHRILSLRLGLKYIL